MQPGWRHLHKYETPSTPCTRQFLRWSSHLWLFLWQGHSCLLLGQLFLQPLKRSHSSVIEALRLRPNAYNEHQQELLGGCKNQGRPRKSHDRVVWRLSILLRKTLTTPGISEDKSTDSGTTRYLSSKRADIIFLYITFQVPL